MSASASPGVRRDRLAVPILAELKWIRHRQFDVGFLAGAARAASFTAPCNEQRDQALRNYRRFVIQARRLGRQFDRMCAWHENPGTAHSN